MVRKMVPNACTTNTATGLSLLTSATGTTMTPIARQMAKAGSFDALCEARGEPERAERHRALLAERGVWPC